ncbi:MAG: hypothetical protein OXU71_12600 [Gammaproteobacteria bacterium]|nr:hypothetical protein [Gammaproteobacteria bacterium]
MNRDCNTVSMTAPALLLAAALLSATARAGDGDGDGDSFSIPGLGLVRAEEIAAPTVSEDQLERDLRALDIAFGAPKPAVTFAGGVASYTGEVNAAGFDALSALAESEAVQTLSVDSLGGEVFWGMKIGELVFARGWDVRVRGICFSSCANYLFPAGKRKIIAAGGIVGWHGSARQDAVLAARAGISEAEEFLRKIVPAMLAGIADSGQPAPRRAEMLAGVSAEFGRHQTRRRMEEAFFARIGVAADSAVYGLRPESGVPQNAGGWTYRLADLAAFGITDVEYLGGNDGDYPPPDKRAFLGLTIATVKR